MLQDSNNRQPTNQWSLHSHYLSVWRVWMWWYVWDSIVLFVIWQCDFLRELKKESSCMWEQCNLHILMTVLISGETTECVRMCVCLTPKTLPILVKVITPSVSKRSLAHQRVVFKPMFGESWPHHVNTEGTDVHVNPPRLKIRWSYCDMYFLLLLETFGVFLWGIFVARG